MPPFFLPLIAISPAAVYQLFAWWCGSRFFSSVTSTIEAERPFISPVTILKPVKGADEESYQNFSSFCCQRYPAQVQLVFAVADPADLAIPVINRLIAEHPQVDCTLIIDGTLHGPNHKVGNLINAYQAAKHEIIIICDSDIRVEPEFLVQTLALFSDPAVGLVTSPYRTSDVHGIADALESLGFTSEMMPNVMVARSLEGLTFALGASMAVRRTALEGIGGFASLADYLADDYQLGNKVHRSGWRVVLSHHFVESVLHREELSSILSRQLRWARTMRASRPSGYLASGITHPTLGLIAAIMVGGFSFATLAAITALYLIRSSVTLCYSRCYTKDRLLPRWLWLLPVRDLISTVTWAMAFLGNTVRWRGRLYRLLPGGKLRVV